MNRKAEPVIGVEVDEGVMNVRILSRRVQMQKLLGVVEEFSFHTPRTVSAQIGFNF
jgi:hypothetical protein